MSRSHRFDEDPLNREFTSDGKTVRLEIVEGEIAERGIYGTIRVYNGRLRADGVTPEPLHAARFSLDSERARMSFTKAALESEPALSGPQLMHELMLISADLTARLTGMRNQVPEMEPPSVDVAALWEQGATLLQAPDLLTRAYEAMQSYGLVGEARNAKLLYIAAIARLRDRVISAFLKGPSSSGKSNLLERVLQLLPSDAVVNFTTISPRFLAYSDHDLRHKIVVIYEAGGLDDGIGAYVMRSLLSEGCIRIGTVDHGEGDRMEAREVIKEGPTALFTSTTSAALDAELETRALTLSTTDTPGQSRAIMRGAASRYTGTAPEPIDLAPFHAAQQWLEAAGERSVTIPFAAQLAEIVPTLAIRIRRDFNKLLDLVAASAFLHQVQRTRDANGAIVATLVDYTIVRDLALESFGAAAQDGLTDKQRQAVIQVAMLQPEAQEGVSLAAVAAGLGIDKSAASRRLANPLREGYVRNLEERKGHPARYAPGDPLPPPITALPDAQDLEQQQEVQL